MLQRFRKSLKFLDVFIYRFSTTFLFLCALFIVFAISFFFSNPDSFSHFYASMSSNLECQKLFTTFLSYKFFKGYPKVLYGFIN